VTGWSYDANGNVTQGPLGTYAYDSVNRLTRADTAWGYEEYGYAANNQRLWKTKSDGTMEVYFYLPDGRLVATYERIWRYYPTEWCLKRSSERVWFGGTLLVADRAAVYTDRLGSVVSRGTPGTTEVYRYYPHGEAFAGNPSTTGPGFATYERDQHAGLDQAWNRGYLSNYGRFAQADPYQASGGAGEPGSWNRYGYVGGDPVNLHDPSGLQAASPADWDPVFVCALGMPYWMPPEVVLLWCGGGGSSPHPTSTTGLDPQSGGGHRGDSRLIVRNLSKSGNAQVRIENTLRWIREALTDDEECSNWLQGARAYIDVLIGQSLFAHGEFDPGVAAFTGTGNTNVPEGYAALVVNEQSAFFRGGLRVGNRTIEGGTDLARVFILLHELAHGLELNDFESDVPPSISWTVNSP
jgi:RHS repeat-associated protein